MKICGLKICETQKFRENHINIPEKKQRNSPFHRTMVELKWVMESPVNRTERRKGEEDNREKKRG